ncbi:hypothetical protein F5X99DRAFT_337629 [Biscogniauxia marginata]|nr:hypothetical protein F5X99DRAFT_337629 [Biscogniauxia marginata]
MMRRYVLTKCMAGERHVHRHRLPSINPPPYCQISWCGIAVTQKKARECDNARAHPRLHNFHLLGFALDADAEICDPHRDGALGVVSRVSRDCSNLEFIRFLLAGSNIAEATGQDHPMCVHPGPLLLLASPGPALMKPWLMISLPQTFRLPAPKGRQAGQGPLAILAAQKLSIANELHRICSVDHNNCIPRPMNGILYLRYARG